MKNKLLLIIGLSIILLFSGCTSTQDRSYSDPQNSLEVIYKIEWWNTFIPDTPDYHFEVSSAKTPDTGISKEIARTNCVSNISSSYLKSAVTSTLSSITYSSMSTEDKSVFIQKVLPEVEIRSRNYISGIEFQYHIEKDGTVYVLAILDKKTIQSIISEVMAER